MFEPGLIAAILVAAVWIAILALVFKQNLKREWRVPGTFPTDSDLEDQDSPTALAPITFSYDPQRARYVLRRYAITTSLWSIVLLYFALGEPVFSDRKPVVLFGTVAWMLIFILPEYLVFRRYQYVSTSASVTISNGTGHIFVDSARGRDTITFDQLWTVARVGKDRPLLGKIRKSELYHFVIETKDDRRIIVTSLMTDLMQLPVSNIATEPRRGFGWISFREGRVLNVASNMTSHR